MFPLAVNETKLDMSTASADRNLLFGVLAVQLDFVSRDDLIAATSRWVLDKEQPLSKVFVEQGLLSSDEKLLIDSIVEKHLQRNDDDARKSLQSLEAFDALRATLSSVDDQELRSTVELQTIPMAPNDPHSTQAHAPTEAMESKQRFTVLRLHQKGGLGRVSIALDEELNREIALKEILAAHADNTENRTRFIREAEITGALEHPGVVPVYSLGKFADGRPYYAMRFIRGMNLQVALEDYHQQESNDADKQLQFRQLLGRFVDVCYALEYAHSRSVIHRDLKPGNIMLGDFGETLVVDWGLAKTLDEAPQTEDTLTMPITTSQRASSTSTQVGRVVGTPAYMSPEQAAGRLDALGPCSDIYSLGATLYHVITGVVPFTGTEEEVLGNVQMGRFDRPRIANASVPRALEAICLKAMARLTTERYGSGRELAEDIERYLADEQVLAYEEPWPSRAWRWIRNHKPLVISSAAALAVAVTVLTVSVVLLSAANVRVTASRDEAEQSYQEADRQRQRAERNFGLARDAVQDYYISVSEDTLLKQPGMQPLRENLLRQALDYYQKFLGERADDPQLREEVAQAHFFTGQITLAIDSPASALPHYEQAAKIQQELLATEPTSAALEAAYATTLNALGGAALRLYEFDEAEQYFQQAIEVRQQLAKQQPDDAEAARQLASSVMNLGNVLSYRGEVDAAIERLQHAQSIRLAHVSDPQAITTQMQRDLGMGYYNLANTYSNIEDVASAESNYLLAIDAFEQLLENDPVDMNNRRRLAVCHRMVGQLQSELGNSPKAIEYYQQAEQTLVQLRLRNPEILEFASDLSGVYLHIGVELAGQQQTDAALESLSKAIGLHRELIEEAPDVPRFRLDLGRCLREEGKLLSLTERHDAAVDRLNESREVLAELVKQEPGDEQYALQLQHTNDELARVTASRENAILKDSEQQE